MVGTSSSECYFKASGRSSDEHGKGKFVNPEDAVELGREALKACLMLGGPIIMIGLLVGLGIGLLQAMTQVQDQTVSVVPKILLMFVGIGLALPWLSEKMIDFTKTSFQSPLVHTREPVELFPTQPPIDSPTLNPMNSEPAESLDAWANRPSMPILDQRFSMPTLQAPRFEMPTLKEPVERPNFPRVAENPETDF